MNWIGKWINQHGSVLDITNQDENKLEGIFKSAVDETTKGQKLWVTGVCQDNLIAVCCCGGDHVVTYAGMYYNGKMETAWHVVTTTTVSEKKEGETAQKKPLAWWQSVKTNVDTFKKIEE